MLSGDSLRIMQSHLLQRFSESANLRVIIFTTVNVLSEDVTCAPNLNDSALELLQALQAQRQQEQEGKARKGSETPEETPTVEVNGLTVPFLFDALDPLPDCVHRYLGI